MYEAMHTSMTMCTLHCLKFFNNVKSKKGRIIALKQTNVYIVYWSSENNEAPFVIYNSI